MSTMPSAQPVHRPFGVSFLSILLMIGGIADIIGGIVLLFHGNDDDVLDAVNLDSGDVTTYAWVTIALGALIVFVGWSLRSGAGWARYLVALIAAFRFFILIWGIIAYDNIHWYSAIWPVLIYGAIAGYLFYDDDAKRFFEARR